MSRKIQLTCPILLFVAAIVCQTGMSARKSQIFGLPSFRTAQTKLVPGGALYPNYNRVGEINAAAIPWDWSNSAEVLYAPPLNETDGHGLVASFTHSRQAKIGISAGYMASLYDGTTLNGGFVGAGLRIKWFSLGMSVRKPILDTTDQSLAFDLSSYFRLTKAIESTFIIRDLAHYPSVVVGLGTGLQKPFSLELNYLKPLFSTADSGAADHRMTLASSLRVGRFEFGGNGTYSHVTSTGKGYWRITAASAYWFSKHFSFVLEYTTRPQTIAFGIGWFAQTKQVTSLEKYLTASGTR